MVLRYLVGELVKQFSTPPNDARMLGLQLRNVVACIYYGLENGIAAVVAMAADKLPLSPW